jgi:two-component system NarL family sensor kinase
MEHEADLFGLGTDFTPVDGDQQNTAVEPGLLFGATNANCKSDETHDPFDLALLPDADRFRFLDVCLDAQESERLRLGRELHDSTGQLLLALRLSVAHLRHMQGIGDTEEVLGEIDETARQIDQEIRTFSFLNYPAELGKCGLIGTLEALVKGFSKRTGIRIDFQATCLRPCPGPLAIALLRVGQEALMNVHRHARATSALVKLVERDGLLELSISDDGRGMPPADHHAVANGVGLQGMRHRIERLGGHFAVRRLKHGTKLVASVPRMQPPAVLAS